MPDPASGTARRDVLRKAVGIAGVCAITALQIGAARAGKIAKTDVRYQDHPNGSQHCALCAFYVAPVACRLVRGEVSPNGWCDQFQPKSG